MTLIAETVQKEKQRIEYMLSEYESRLTELPKGTLTETKNGDNVYYYLKYRVGKKVVSKYIPFDAYEKTQEEISQRKHIERMIKDLKEELKFANKALGVKK